MTLSSRHSCTLPRYSRSSAVASALIAVSALVPSPAPAEAATAPSLSISASPTRIDAAREETVHVRVRHTSRRGRPVPRALVRAGSARARTNARGLARLTVSYTRAREATIVATRRGFRTGRTRITVRRPTHHVDCHARDGGDGSRDRPFNTLDGANAAPLEPGARVLLRRGTACTGTLAPRTGGTSALPLVLGSYGAGPLPRIDAVEGQAVLLKDLSHVTVERLELTNRGDFRSRRRGIHVTAETGVVRGIVIRGLHVHDVHGDQAKDGVASGGIELDVVATAGEPHPRFDGVLVEGNRVEDVYRSGIRLDGTTDGSRPPATAAWPEASTNVRVRGNRLDRIGGDGIIPTGTVGAVIEDNVVANGNLRGAAITDPEGFSCNAGIWTFHANGTVIQRNEVYGMRFTECDGTGFDIDYDQDGTVIQFNFSHDNEGGFLLVCTNNFVRRTAEVRFNLSLDDGHQLRDSPCALQLGTYEGVRVFNNTFAGRDPTFAVLDPLGLEFRNNVVYATAPTVRIACGLPCSHNLFFNFPPTGTNAVVGDPRFADPGRPADGRLDAGRGYRLSPGSPAIAAGTRIPGTPEVDYFGEPVPREGPPSIGFHQP